MTREHSPRNYTLLLIYSTVLLAVLHEETHLLTRWHHHRLTVSCFCQSVQVLSSSQQLKSPARRQALTFSTPFLVVERRRLPVISSNTTNNSNDLVRHLDNSEFFLCCFILTCLSNSRLASPVGSTRTTRHNHYY